MDFIPALAFALVAFAPSAFSQEAPAPSKAAAVTRVTGEVTAVADGEITVKTDAGSPASFKIGPATSFLRISPGEKDLSKATRIALTDIAVGDRVLARIRTAAEGQPPNPASLVYLMNKAELAKHQESSRAEWQRRGAAGKVSTIDPAAQTMNIKIQTPTGLKDVAVKTSAKTSFRRYAPESIRFSDARPGTMADIHVGDNLRVLGDRSEDGSSITAEEIVSGTFRNIAGTILAIDAAKGELRVNDLETKKPLTVKISSDTTLKKLPAQMAAFMARSRQVTAAPGTGGGPGARPGAPGNPGAPGATAPGPEGQPPSAGQGPRPGGPFPPAGGAQNRQAGEETPPAAANPAMAGMRGGPGGGGPGRGDFQQMMERIPAITLADLKTGDALIISSTAGSDPSRVFAITAVAGVEPLLTASPSGPQSVLNGSWNFGEVGLPQ